MIENRTPCQWASIGAGALAFGLGGGFGMSTLDVSATTSGGVILAGAVFGAGVGALAGFLVGEYVCPEPAVSPLPCHQSLRAPQFKYEPIPPIQ